MKGNAETYDEELQMINGSNPVDQNRIAAGGVYWIHSNKGIERVKALNVYEQPVGTFFDFSVRMVDFICVNRKGCQTRFGRFSTQAEDAFYATYEDAV